MSRFSLIIKAMFSRRWLLATIIVLAAMATMIRLGFWQLDRLEQRRAANAALTAVLASDPLPLTADLHSETPDALKDRQVVAEGAFDFEEQVILLVQNWSGQPGVHLLTPYVLDGTDTAVIVDRGWVPQRDVNAADLDKYNTAETGSLNGFVALSQPLSRYGNAAAQPEGPQGEVYRVDVEMLQAQMPYDLLPFYVLQAPDGNEQPPFRAEPEIDLSEGPHLSYAIQWFLFTIVVGVGYVMLLHKRLDDDRETAVAQNDEASSFHSPEQVD